MSLDHFISAIISRYSAEIPVSKRVVFETQSKVDVFTAEKNIFYILLRRIQKHE